MPQRVQKPNGSERGSRRFCEHHFRTINKANPPTNWYMPVDACSKVAQKHAEGSPDARSALHNVGPFAGPAYMTEKLAVPGLKPRSDRANRSN